MSAGWIFLAAVVIFAVYAGLQFWRYRDSSNWPATDGVIEGEPEMHPLDNGPSRYAIVFYSYSVAGERFSGEWNSPTFATEAKVRAFLTTNLPKGTKVVVRYRPNKPSLSVMDFDIPPTDGPIQLGI